MTLGHCNHNIFAEEMDRDWCISLIEMSGTVDVPDSVAVPMSVQCAKFQEDAFQAIDYICGIEDTEARKVAADNFNYLHREEYSVYAAMVRTLREYMERKCLGSLASSMSYEVIKNNSEINTMFTIFRSRRPLPKQ